MDIRCVGAGAVCALAVAGSNAAIGSTLPPELDGFSIDILYNGDQHWTSDDSAFSMVEQQGEGNQMFWHLEGGATFGGGAGGATFDLNLDTDPFIASSFNFTNGLGAVQNFVLTVTIPAGPPFGASLINGSFSGSVLDMNGVGGATVATLAGSGFYEALVDGVAVKTLDADPFSVSAPLQGTANIPTVNYGPENGPGLIAQIGIRNSFSVTPGDAAQMVSTFNIVEFIPAPGSLALAGLAALAAVRRRR